MGQHGVDEILRDARSERPLLLSLINGLEHMIAKPPAARSKTENSAAKRIMQTLLLVTQYCRIATEGMLSLRELLRDLLTPEADSLTTVPFFGCRL